MCSMFDVTIYDFVLGIRFATILVLQTIPRLVLDVYYYNFAHLGMTRVFP